MVPGAFVRVLFPTSEKPRQPGLIHIGYLLGSTASEEMIVYTTSKLWPVTTPLPAGARFFDTDDAKRLNQSKPFIQRMDVLARLPMTKVWFPDIERSGGGIIAIASARLQAELAELATNLVRRRRALMQMRGLYR